MSLSVARPEVLWALLLAVPLVLLHLYRRRRMVVPFLPLLVEAVGPRRAGGGWHKLRELLSLILQVLAVLEWQVEKNPLKRRQITVEAARQRRLCHAERLPIRGKGPGVIPKEIAGELVEENDQGQRAVRGFCQMIQIAADSLLERRPKPFFGGGIELARALEPDRAKLAQTRDRAFHEPKTEKRLGDVVRHGNNGPDRMKQPGKPRS